MKFSATAKDIPLSSFKQNTKQQRAHSKSLSRRVFASGCTDSLGRRRWWLLRGDTIGNRALGMISRRSARVSGTSAPELTGRTGEISTHRRLKHRRAAGPDGFYAFRRRPTRAAASPLEPWSPSGRPTPHGKVREVAGKASGCELGRASRCLPTRRTSASRVGRLGT